MNDASRPRSFFCDDRLWYELERVAIARQIPVDHVLDEAIRSYLGGGQPAQQQRPQAPPPLPGPQGYGHPPPGYPQTPAGPPPARQPPPGYSQTPPPAQQGPHPPPGRQPPPGYSQTPPPAQAGPHPPPGGFPAPSSPARSAPPQAQRQPTAPPPPSQATGMPAYPLYAYYNGQRHVIHQPRYVIGRSRKTCDIVLNDSNVSRQHAAVEWIGNGFYIVDMGSTNGIEFHGQRVMRKLLHEGDMIRIAGHEIHFSYAR